MDTRHVLHEIHFEWNSTKAEENLVKHNVDFEIACHAFFDPFVYVLEEEMHSGEVREALLGMTLQWNVICRLYDSPGRCISHHIGSTCYVGRKTNL